MNTVTLYIIYIIKRGLISVLAMVGFINSVYVRSCGRNYKQKKHSKDNSFDPKVKYRVRVL